MSPVVITSKSENHRACPVDEARLKGQRFERCCEYKEYRITNTEGHSEIYACGDWRLQSCLRRTVPVCEAGKKVSGLELHLCSLN